jgi:hypothetical protein
MHPEVVSFSSDGFGRATRPRTWREDVLFWMDPQYFRHAAHPFDPSVLDAGAARTDSHPGTRVRIQNPGVSRMSGMRECFGSCSIGKLGASGDLSMVVATSRDSLGNGIGKPMRPGQFTKKEKIRTR